MSVLKIKQLLGIIDGLAFLSVDPRKEGQAIDQMFADLTEKADIDKINALIQ